MRKSTEKSATGEEISD
jgi:hypothetical protein